MQLLQARWLERLIKFQVYLYILENHIMIYIEAEKKRSLGSVARGISVGRKLVSKYLSLQFTSYFHEKQILNFHECLSNQNEYFLLSVFLS